MGEWDTQAMEMFHRFAGKPRDEVINAALDLEPQSEAGVWAAQMLVAHLKERGELGGDLRAHIEWMIEKGERLGGRGEAYPQRQLEEASESMLEHSPLQPERLLRFLKLFTIDELRSVGI